MQLNIPHLRHVFIRNVINFLSQLNPLSGTIFHELPVVYMIILKLSSLLYNKSQTTKFEEFSILQTLQKQLLKIKMINRVIFIQTLPFFIQLCSRSHFTRRTKAFFLASELSTEKINQHMSHLHIKPRLSLDSSDAASDIRSLNFCPNHSVGR